MDSRVLHFTLQLNFKEAASEAFSDQKWVWCISNMLYKHVMFVLSSEER